MFKKSLQFVLIFVVITSWIFSGWPQIYNFPPKIKNTNTEKNVKQNKESPDNVRAGSRGSKMRITNIGDDLSSNQSVAESKLKVILASLIIVYIVLARFVVLL